MRSSLRSGPRFRPAPPRPVPIDERTSDGALFCLGLFRGGARSRRFHARLHRDAPRAQSPGPSYLAVRIFKGVSLVPKTLATKHTEGNPRAKKHGLTEAQIAVHWKEEAYIRPPARFI